MKASRVVPTAGIMALVVLGCADILSSSWYCTAQRRTERPPRQNTSAEPTAPPPSMMRAMPVPLEATIDRILREQRENREALERLKATLPR